MSIPQYDFSFDMEKNRNLAEAWNRYPSLASREAMRRMGLSPDSLFGQKMSDIFRDQGAMERITGYFNPSMPDRNSNNMMQGPQRMMEAAARFAIANPNDPRYLSYGKLADMFGSALSGDRSTLFGEKLNAIAPGTGQEIEYLAGFIRDFAGTVISEDRADLMLYELERLQEQYFNSSYFASGGAGTKSFMQYLVDTAADTLDRWFGDRDWSAWDGSSQNVVNNTGAGNQGPGSGGGSGSGGTGGRPASGSGREGFDPGPHGIVPGLDARTPYSQPLISPQAASSGLPDQAGQWGIVQEFIPSPYQAEAAYAGPGYNFPSGYGRSGTNAGPDFDWTNFTRQLMGSRLPSIARNILPF